MPSRFNGSTEELYEVGSSVSRLLAVLHDSILAHPRPCLNGSTNEVEHSEESLGGLDKAAHVASVLLTLFDHGQIILELGALRRGESERQVFIFVFLLQWKNNILLSCLTCSWLFLFSLEL
jgi:hypothetical protein